MIIIGVDFSPGSAAAASVALRLAGRDGSRCRLLHVRPRSLLEDGSAVDPERWLERLGATGRDIESRDGVAWIELVRAVGESDASMLVVGTHGQSGFQPLRLGRTAESVALRSPAPVLLVSPTHTAANAVVSHGATTISQEGSR